MSLLEEVTSASHESFTVISLTSSTSSDSLIDLTISPTSHNSPASMTCPTSSENPIDLTISPTTLSDPTVSDSSLTSVNSLETSYQNK